MRILVVEDELELAETIAEGLRLSGYSVDLCGDGAAASETALLGSYDLILLDLNLPGKDGLQVLRELRQGKADAKVLILTARSSVPDRVAGLDCGADDYLAKPLRLKNWRQGCAVCCGVSLFRRMCVFPAGSWSLTPFPEMCGPKASPCR